MFGKLKVYAGEAHPHKAQKPQAAAIHRRAAR
jgi:ribosomal protein L13